MDCDCLEHAGIVGGMMCILIHISWERWRHLGRRKSRVRLQHWEKVEFMRWIRHECHARH